MSKVLAIAGYGGPSVDVFQAQLGCLFGEELEIVKCRLDESLPPEATGADLCLFSSFSDYTRIDWKGRTLPSLFAQRTLTRLGLEKLMALPAGTEILLLDEGPELARTMAETIVQLGVRHLRLTPVTADFLEHRPPSAIIASAIPVPSGLGEAMDIGPALLDIGTIIDLAIRLDLDHMIELHNIRESYLSMVTGNIGFAEILGKTNRVAGSVDILLQFMGAGVVAVNAKGKIVACNEEAKALMRKHLGDPAGLSATDMLPDIPFDLVLSSKTPVKGRIGRLGAKEVAYSLEPILHSGVLYGVIGIFDVQNEEVGKRRSPRPSLVSEGYRAKYRFEDIVGRSASLLKCKEIARRMAASTSSVLICGESGTGKEMFAQAMHNASGRRSCRFVAVNCGALPESLLESELFGYEEGAFTGARKGGKPGLFELAHHGTLFLDEISEMPLSIQLRLLRVLEERQVMRLGDDRILTIDIRVIAATNRELRELVRLGTFREDLYYRLAVLPLSIPPLRERREDILLLVEAFQKIFGCHFELSKRVQEAFLAHRWRGNARELRNYVEYAANLGIGCLDPEDLPFETDSAPEGTSVRLPPQQAGGGSVVTEPGEHEDEVLPFVLEALETAFGNHERLGRRSLWRLAMESNRFISEPQIRKALKCLEQNSLIRIYPGKGGTVITEKGRRAIEAMHSEIRTG